MKCKECGKLYGNMKDDGIVVNPHLGQLCIYCWHKTQPPLEGVRPGYGIAKINEESRIFKCPNCKRVKEKDDDIIMVQCVCGDHMVWVDKNHKPIDIRTDLMKECDANKCDTCPARGVKCF